MTEDEIHDLRSVLAKARGELLRLELDRPEAEEDLVAAHLASKARPSTETRSAYYVAAARVRAIHRAAHDLRRTIRAGDLALAEAGVDDSPF